MKKAMELLPLGPVVILDTPGFDDEGPLGEQRVGKTREALSRTDLAVLVTDARREESPGDRDLEALFRKGNVPFLHVRTKADLLETREPLRDGGLYVSAVTGEGIGELKTRLGQLAARRPPARGLLDGVIGLGDTALLVTPIDASAPKGRLILPQQQTMRALLDLHCPFLTCQDTDLPQALSALRTPPALVITDSQAFARVAKAVPEHVPLTSFSLLFARYKGNLFQMAQGAARLSALKDGDRVLISEGCTHHRQCNDIGTVKLPGWIREYAQAKPDFSFTSGGEFPEDLSGYALVVHCGGCMLNAREMGSRLTWAAEQGVPVVNYGAAIAQIHGILERSLRPFPELPASLRAALLGRKRP